MRTAYTRDQGRLAARGPHRGGPSLELRLWRAGPFRLSDGHSRRRDLGCRARAGERSRADPPGRADRPIEDDPNLTDQRFLENPTRSYRTGDPLRVLGEVADWEPHPPEVLQHMLERLEELRRQGVEAIED